MNKAEKQRRELDDKMCEELNRILDELDSSEKFSERLAYAIGKIDITMYMHKRRSWNTPQ